MTKELELFSLEGLSSFFKQPRKAHYTLSEGESCRNCDTVLEGLYCHVCGQNADTKHRTIFHLIWETIEGMFHLDGRLWRTLPNLFFRPGTLAKDYIEGRITRHVPPFRMFLVALLLFILSAEYVVHQAQHAADHKTIGHASGTHGPAVQLSRSATNNKEMDSSQTPTSEKPTLKDLEDPIKLEALKARLIKDAGVALATAKAEAASSRQEQLGETSDAKAREAIESEYLAELQSAQNRYDKIIKDPYEAANQEVINNLNLINISKEESAFLKRSIQRAEINASSTESKEFAEEVKKNIITAIENPKLFILNMFTMGHRLAVMLLPLMTLFLGFAFFYRRKYFISDHFLVACNIMSFIFLTNALGFVLPEVIQVFWFAALLIAIPINMFMTIRGAYDSGFIGSLIKTTLLWILTFLSSVLIFLLLGYLSIKAL